MLAGLCSFLNAIGVNLFSCLFLFLDDVYIPYLVDPSSIFKASNCITLTSAPYPKEKPQPDGRRGAIIIKSNPILSEWVTTKVENTNTK